MVEPAGPVVPHRVPHLFRRRVAHRGRDAGRAVADLIASRAKERARKARTRRRLLAKGQDAVLKKIGEEATEVVLAAKAESDERLAEESADLLYHLLVALHQRGRRCLPRDGCAAAAAEGEP